MGYVYPNELMIARDQSSKILKGALMLSGIILFILGLFLLSDFGTEKTSYMHCIEDPIEGIHCTTR